MPKGRVNVPSAACDGIWFQHRGLPDPGPLTRNAATCTGRMLTAPFQADSSGYPPQPPNPYKQKDTRNFKVSNNFSNHDNRHSFQDHGVYFGDGRSTRHLGKNHVESDERQHHTDKHFLKHRGREVVDHDYNTIKAVDYRGLPTAEPPRHRRFARNHAEGQTGLAKLTTDTTLWTDPAKDPDHRTPLHVLAITQEPLLPANNWKYSNHGKASVYPSYNHIHPRKQEAYTMWHLDAPHVAAANARLRTMTTHD